MKSSRSISYLEDKAVDILKHLKKQGDIIEIKNDYYRIVWYHDRLTTQTFCRCSQIPTKKQRFHLSCLFLGAVNMKSDYLPESVECSLSACDNCPHTATCPLTVKILGNVSFAVCINCYGLEHTHFCQSCDCRFFRPRGNMQWKEKGVGAWPLSKVSLAYQWRSKPRVRASPTLKIRVLLTLDSIMSESN